MPALGELWSDQRHSCPSIQQEPSGFVVGRAGDDNLCSFDVQRDGESPGPASDARRTAAEIARGLIGIPLLRKQKGFKDEITFAGLGGIDVTAISLWENKTDAEAYNTNTYPEVLKTMARFIEGTPKVQTSDVVNSTFHKIAIHAAA